MSTLSIDFETHATVDLRKSGVYPYAMHKDTAILCMAWSFGDEDPENWEPGTPLPSRLVDHINNGGEIRAWNAQFERVIWKHAMSRAVVGECPMPRDEQFVCSAAEAAAMALPRSLDQAAKVLGVAAQKDKDGYALMLRMTRPRKILDDGTPVWWENEAGRLDRLVEYCKQDVRTERSCVGAMRRLTPHEREIYLLDQRMNDRGVALDLPLILASQAIAIEGIERANAIISELTRGEVKTVTNHKRLTEWVRARGVETDGVSKANVREMMESDLDPTVRAALAIRAEAGRSSVAKLSTMLESVCPDGRVRGMLMYHAASTGRWAGRLVQPQNFPRGEIDRVERFIPDVLAGAYDTIDMFAPPVVVISSLLRGMLAAAPGNQFYCGDYAAIEARVLNWVAGQRDVTALFHAYDDAPKALKPNFDPYRHNAARLYNIPLDEVQKFPHRQTGKFQELGCGYQMGWKKAVDAAKDVYQLDLTVEKSQELVKAYRNSHEKVVALWASTNQACIDAVNTPGVAIAFGDEGRLRAVKAGAYLYLILPSGRPLVFASPKIVEAETPWSREAREEAAAFNAQAVISKVEEVPIPAVTTRPALEFAGVDPNTKQWGRLRTYGGALVENIVQAIARDLMADAKLRLEEAGYTPLLSIHDEVLCETDLGFGSVNEYESLMAALPTWATGCPVAAEGWKGPRYKK